MRFRSMSSNNQKFSAEEFMKIAFGLEDHHVIFNKFFCITKPVFSEDIPTACVAFDKIGDCINFMINPKFWSESSFEKKKFIASHECLHVILSHGFRMTNLHKGERKIANVAMDLVVNHMLVDRFGFNRQEVDPKNEFCWLDNVLKEKLDAKQIKLSPERSFEHYFNIIKENADRIETFEFDDHEGLDSFNCKEFVDKFKKQLEECNTDEMQSLKELIEAGKLKEGNGGKETSSGKQAGSEAGDLWRQIDLSRPVYKKKWETIIKGLCRKSLSTIEVEQWARKPRRLTNISSNCFLPSDMEIDEVERSRPSIWLYLDTSGSCSDLAPRFLKAARSIPPKHFDVRAFCFDTKVYEIDLKDGKLAGFGGTSFQCIDAMVRKEIRKGIKHPDALVVVTDGYGDHINMEKPKSWYWLLSENVRDCIPSDCHIYDLKQFE